MSNILIDKSILVATIRNSRMHFLFTPKDKRMKNETKLKEKIKELELRIKILKEDLKRAIDDRNYWYLNGRR